MARSSSHPEFNPQNLDTNSLNGGTVFQNIAGEETVDTTTPQKPKRRWGRALWNTFGIGTIFILAPGFVGFRFMSMQLNGDWAQLHREGMRYSLYSSPIKFTQEQYANGKWWLVQNYPERCEVHDQNKACILNSNGKWIYLPINENNAGYEGSVVANVSQELNPLRSEMKKINSEGSTLHISFLDHFKERQTFATDSSFIVEMSSTQEIEGSVHFVFRTYLIDKDGGRNHIGTLELLNMKRVIPTDILEPDWKLRFEGPNDTSIMLTEEAAIYGKDKNAVLRHLNIVAKDEESLSISYLK